MIFSKLWVGLKPWSLQLDSTSNTRDHRWIKTFHAWVVCILCMFSLTFFFKVSESLRYDWLPIEDDDLPMAVLRDEADAEAAYMNTLLSDQVWEGE